MSDIEDMEDINKTREKVRKDIIRLWNMVFVPYLSNSCHDLLTKLDEVSEETFISFIIQCNPQIAKLEADHLNS